MVHYFSLTQRHVVTEANYGFYKQAILHPTRVLPVHDFVYILEGEWTIGQENESYRAKKDDVVILAGKGHEDYQIIGKEKRHFDETEILFEIRDEMIKGE